MRKASWGLGSELGSVTSASFCNPKTNYKANLVSRDREELQSQDSIRKQKKEKLYIC